MIPKQGFENNGKDAGVALAFAQKRQGCWRCPCLCPKTATATRWVLRKKTASKCNTKKVIKGNLLCVKGTQEGYYPDKKLSKIPGNLSCYLPGCTSTEFPDLLEKYITKKQLNVSLGHNDFELTKTRPMKAWLYCGPAWLKKSKSKCTCKMKKGKRKFKCSNLETPKGCK